MDQQFEKFRHSVGGKALFIGLLVLILLIPRHMVESLIVEHGGRAAEARAEVADIWGLGQTIGAPVLCPFLRFFRSTPFSHTRIKRRFACYN